MCQHKIWVIPVLEPYTAWEVTKDLLLAADRLPQLPIFSSIHYLWCTTRFTFRTPFIFHLITRPYHWTSHRHNSPWDMAPRCLAAVTDCFRLRCQLAGTNFNGLTQSQKLYCSVLTIYLYRTFMYIFWSYLHTLTEDTLSMPEFYL